MTVSINTQNREDVSESCTSDGANPGPVQTAMKLALASIVLTAMMTTGKASGTQSMEDNGESQRKKLISNPVAYVYVDGNRSDWEPLESFGTDPMDMNGEGNLTDWKRAYFSHNGKSLFIGIEKHLDSEVLYSHATYLDTDMDSETGYAVCGIGADIMIQRDKVYLHAGKNQDYLWHPCTEATVVSVGTFVEMELPLNALNNPETARVVFIADNRAHGGDSVDYYPDQLDPAHPQGPWFVYDFRPVPAMVAPQKDPAAVTNFSTNIHVDGQLEDWRHLTSFGRDGNDITDAAPCVDWLECWMANDELNLYLAIELEAATGLNFGHTIYLDTDQNPKSGFRLFSLGADYLIQKDTLFHYVGNGNIFYWEPVTKLHTIKSGNIMEMVLPRMTIGNPFQIRVGYLGDNALFLHDENDHYPDNLNGLKKQGRRYHVYYFSTGASEAAVSFLYGSDLER